MASVQQLPSLEAPLSPLSSRPKRSVVERSLCGCTYLEMFFNRASMDLRALLEDENGFCSATTFARSAPLPFVISTEAKRSGEISVWMHLLGNVFQQSIDGPAGPPKKTKIAFIQQLPSLEAPLSPLSSRPKRNVVERSLCGCTYLEMFFNRASMDLRAHLEDENGFYSATTLARSTPLPFVISTEAKRSGEISVWMHLLGNVFQQSIDGPAGPPEKTKMASIQQLPSLEAPLSPL